MSLITLFRVSIYMYILVEGEAAQVFGVNTAHNTSKYISYIALTSCSSWSGDMMVSILRGTVKDAPR